MYAQKTISLVTVLFVLFYSSCIIAQIKIYSDSSQFDFVGYDNCDMRTNGEHCILQHYIKPDTVVFDVGANVGEWSAGVLRQASNVQLYSFEPIPAVFNTLQKNVASHAVKFFNMAFSNTQGIQEFQYYVNHSVLSGLFERPILLTHVHETPQIIQVTTDTLDNFCNAHAVESIDFLKIDTEGAELAILQGSMELLQNQRVQYIQFEYGGCYFDARTTLQEAYRILTACNYDVYRIVPNGLIHITQWRDALENYRYSNYFAVAKR